MFVFTGALILFFFVHIFQDKAIIYICDKFTITDEKVATMNAADFLIIQSFVTTINLNYGDANIKNSIIKSITTIQKYYKDLDETKSFEALKVLPSLIHMLGRDYQGKEKMRDVWIGSGVFLNIMADIQIKQIHSISINEINDLLVFFRDNCATYALQGIKDRSFLELFNTLKHQEMYLALFVKIAGNLKAQSIASYLIQSDMSSDRLVAIYGIINRNEYEFMHEVFAQVVAERSHNFLSSRDPLEVANLMSLYRFVKENKLISRTELEIFKRVISSF